MPTDTNFLSRIAPRTLLVAALLLTAAVVGTLGVVALTPQHDLPVGTAVAEGNSMGAAGDQFVVYAQIGAEVGDVVIFDAGEHGFVRHRVVASTPEGFVTKGDANAQVDQHALSAQLDGMPYATADRVRGVSLMAVPVALVEAVESLGTAPADPPEDTSQATATDAGSATAADAPDAAASPTGTTSVDEQAAAETLEGSPDAEDDLGDFDADEFGSENG